MLAVLAAAVLALGSAQAPAPSWHPDVRAARRYALHRDGVVSFAVRAQERRDGPVRVWGFRQARPARSASVIKAMLLTAYLERPDVRGRALRADERALLSPMIQWSANEAATVMLGRVGAARLERDARRWGMRRFRVGDPWGMSRITAGDQARFWLRFDRLLPPRHRAFGLWLTSHIIPGQRWGIASVVPKGWTLHFKGGWGSGPGLVDHQIALLTRGGQRVSVAILARGQDSHAYGQETLRGVAVRLLRGLARAPRPARHASA